MQHRADATGNMCTKMEVKLPAAMDASHVGGVNIPGAGEQTNYGEGCVLDMKKTKDRVTYIIKQGSLANVDSTMPNGTPNKVALTRDLNSDGSTSKISCAVWTGHARRLSEVVHAPHQLYALHQERRRRRLQEEASGGGNNDPTTVPPPLHPKCYVYHCFEGDEVRVLVQYSIHVGHM